MNMDINDDDPDIKFELSSNDSIEAQAFYSVTSGREPELQNIHKRRANKNPRQKARKR